MMFNNHLSKLKSKIRKYKIHSFDIETHGYMNRFFFGGYYDERYHSFMTKEDMISHIKGIKTKDLLICATNLSFDFFALFYDRQYMKNFNPIMRHSNIIMCKLFNHKFVDTRNYSPMSVKQLGKYLNLHKLSSKYAKTGTMPKTFNQLKKYKYYNSQDCLISKRFLEECQQMFNELGCELKMTIASTAMNLYRRRYIPFTIYKESIECKEMIYKAYYGGRTEAFQRGKLGHYGDIFYYYDFNSLYPSCMLNKYPLPSSARYTEQTSEKLIQKYEGISEVRITREYMKYPLLPYRKNGKLIFPCSLRGFKGYYTHIELREALKLGYKIKRVYKTLYYTKTFYPFREYVRDLYKKRLEYQKQGNEMKSLIIKLLLNSLYGKFAMKNVQETSIDDFSEKEIGTGFYVDDESMIGYKTTEKTAENNYIIPILSCYTTAYGRIKLHRKIMELKPLYCDTDSLLSRKKIKTSKRLGNLKLERIIRDGYIIKPKMYYFIDKDRKDYVKVKGFAKMTAKEFLKTITGKGMKQMQFMKFKQSIKRRYSVNQKLIYDKYADVEDDKRVWFSPFDASALQDSEPYFV